MAADGFAAGEGCGDLADHFRIIADDTRKIHDFAEADDIGPGHRLAHILRADFGARRLEARCARYAAWDLDEDADRQGHRLVMHQPDAAHAENVADLVRVDEHRRRAMRDHGAGEFRHRHHAAFDMHVAVAKTGDEI